MTYYVIRFISVAYLEIGQGGRLGDLSRNKSPEAEK